MTPQPDVSAPSAEATEPRRTDIVVGIPRGSGASHHAQAAAQVEAEVKRHFPDRRANVLYLTRRGHGEVEAVPLETAPSESYSASSDPPSPASGAFFGPMSALPALLREAGRLQAPLCALVAPQPHDDRAEWLRLLLDPILEQEFDFVCPSYRRGKLEGLINNGIVYPLTRALYGRRLRQPLGGELALSHKLASALLEDEEWQTDPVHAGADIWLVTKVLSREYRVCQAFLGRAPNGVETSVDLSETLFRVLGLLFHEMERHPATWQRIVGSEPIPTFGVSDPLEEASHDIDVSRMLDAFELGYQDLREIWSLVLPPATLVGLKRISKQAASTFRFPDELWVRLVYDFALGYHMRLMERAQMLRSMTPLYLGWAAGLVNELKDLNGAAAEARIERLCQVFEESKSYLISRWRWPDRFNP